MKMSLQSFQDFVNMIAREGQELKNIVIRDPLDLSPEVHDEIKRLEVELIVNRSLSEDEGFVVFNGKGDRGANS